MKGKNSLVKKISKWALPFAVGGALIYGSLPGKTETKVLKYQGWTPFEGKSIMVFDDKPLYEREGKPEYQVVSNLDTNLNVFETERIYKVTIEKPNWNLFDDKVVSMEKLRLSTD